MFGDNKIFSMINQLLKERYIFHAFEILYEKYLNLSYLTNVTIIIKAFKVYLTIIKYIY